MDRTTVLMCVALVAGLYAGTTMAQSLYRQMRHRRLEGSRRQQLDRWEDEGGAIGAAFTTPPAD